MGRHKKPFNFSYTKPCLDWFDTVNVTLNYDDYYYYKLERRFGPSWWIIGCNTIEKPNYHWEEKEIGRINDYDLLRFIEWNKTKFGNKIVEIKVINGGFNIFDEVKKLIK